MLFAYICWDIFLETGTATPTYFGCLNNVFVRPSAWNQLVT